MPRNRVQHQKGLSDDAFERLYPDEEACRKAWFAWRWPEGFKCPRCAGSKYCEIRGRQLLQCRQCRYQTSLIAGTVLQGTKLPMRVWFRAMHLLAQGKKGLSNIELGRRLGISTNAAWRVQHKLMQAMIERDRRYKLGAAGPRIEIDDAYIGGERTGEGSGRGRRGHTPFIIAVETSKDGRPLYARCKSCAGSRPPKPSGYAPVSRPELPSSATAGNGFVALPWQPGLLPPAPRHRLRSHRRPTSRLPLGKYRARQRQKQPLGYPPRRRGQTSAALPRRLRLALQSPRRPEYNRRATGHRRRREFEQRITGLRQRIKTWEQQADTLEDEAALRRTLSLIIGRLEDFAKQVRQRMDAPDWSLQRDLIRLLVKRVEVDHDEINVVFRVAPPPASLPPGPKGGRSWQDCWKGCRPSLAAIPWCTQAVNRVLDNLRTPDQPRAELL